MSIPVGVDIPNAFLGCNQGDARRRFIRLAGLLFAFGWLTGCATERGDASRDSAPVHTRMTDEDIALADQTVHRALEGEVSGAVLEWRNAASGNSGSVVPVRTYKTAEGTYCRAYREVIQIGHASERYETTACRSAAGAWQPI